MRLPPPGGIVGRASELAGVDAFLQASEQGFAVLALEGEPGIGKIFVTDTGDPVAGATVTVGKHQAVTKTLGVANFNYPGTPSGAVTVTVSAPAYHPVTGSAAL